MRKSAQPFFSKRLKLYWDYFLSSVFRSCFNIAGGEYIVSQLHSSLAFDVDVRDPKEYSPELTLIVKMRNRDSYASYNHTMEEVVKVKGCITVSF